MRTLLTTLVVVGLLAAPSLGVINITVAADGPVVDGKVQLNNAGTTTIRLYAQGTASGIYSIAGDIIAAGPTLLTSNVGSFVWAPEMTPIGLFTPKQGSAGPNGGWSNFASVRTDYLMPDSNFAKDSMALMCSYTVTAASTGTGDITLSFVGKTVNGIKTSEVETDKSTILGTFTPVTISVVPEPTVLTLMALGGLAMIRRHLR